MGFGVGRDQSKDRVWQSLSFDLLSRDPDGSWVQSQHDGLDTRIDLPSIQASLKLADVFEDLDLDEGA